MRPLHRRRGGLLIKLRRAAGELPVRRAAAPSSGSRWRSSAPCWSSRAGSSARASARSSWRCGRTRTAAKALGVDTLRVKLGAITLSGAVTAAAGAFYAQYFLYIDANIAYGTGSRSRRCWRRSSAASAPCSARCVGAVALHGLGEVTKRSRRQLPGIDLVLFGVVLIADRCFRAATACLGGLAPPASRRCLRAGRAG